MTKFTHRRTSFLGLCHKTPVLMSQYTMDHPVHLHNLRNVGVLHLPSLADTRPHRANWAHYVPRRSRPRCRSLRLGMKALTKYRFRNHRVDTFDAVDELRHPQVHGLRAQVVGIVAREAAFGYEVLDHLAHGHAGGFVEIGVEAQSDLMRRRLRARPSDEFGLVQLDADRAAQRGF